MPMSIAREMQHNIQAAALIFQRANLKFAHCATDMMAESM